METQQAMRNNKPTQRDSKIQKQQQQKTQNDSHKTEIASIWIVLAGHGS